jgi:hypothetical protein
MKKLRAGSGRRSGKSVRPQGARRTRG